MDQDYEPIKEFLENADAPKFNFDEAYARLQEMAKANTAHTPHQEGPYLVCSTCSHRHTIGYIGMDKRLAGISENGEPILERRPSPGAEVPTPSVPDGGHHPHKRRPSF